ncbi:MAG: RagB/SusD family nutrient uptake outer membrane protein [Carboxylicivirga sp.]|jgi:hypothetical protein|nr:RagB/SusD family nutrient uptake outer membrane protein [Carboxylicivirga sp.]
MKKISLIISVFAVFMLTSCDDYIDIVPRGSAIAESLEDVDALLEYASIYSGNDNGIPEYVNDNIVMTQGAKDYYGSSSWFESELQIYNLNKSFYLPHQREFVWGSHYATIQRCNYILEITPEMSGDELVRNHYIGEAKVHRAHAYWRLVNMFGQHYGSSIASEDGSGVPILTQFGDVEASLERTSVNGVYEYIVAELIEAIGLLREGRPFVDRINKAAAQAMLARVYLHMGMYTEALEQANMTLAYNSSLIDYNTLADGEMMPRFDANPEHVLYKEGNVPSFYGPLGRAAVLAYSPSLVGAFDNPDEDLRFSQLTQLNSEGLYTIADFNNGFPIGVTVPELMLIKAECLAQNESDKDEAIAVVNMLRENRFSTAAVGAGDHILTTTDKQDALSQIFNERRLEFHILGMRFFDIKRLNQQYDAGISLTRGDVTWGPNSINWAVPIPDSVIETGKGELLQNPRE